MSGFFQSIITVVLFIFILGTLVIIHELGHFVTARLAKVRVLEFGIGFPPRAKVMRSGGETLYTLNWLPIGGFVKLEGEDGNDADDPRSFAAQRYLTKMLILVAGVAMNILLAFVIFTGIAWLASPFVGVKFFEVQPGSPAAAAGLQAGEAIIAVDGEHYQFITGPNAVIAPAGASRRHRRADHRRHVRRPPRRAGHAPARVGDQRTAGSARDLRREPAVRGLLLRRIHAERPADRDPGRRPRDGALDGPHRRWAGEPRRIRRQRPDRAAAGRPVRSASRPRSATSSGTAGRSCCSTSPASCRPTWPS